jgi:tetratricopeptide (TPR) repeat protein
MLHSGARRFGPLSEDELRDYFRAGMVKSVDRISAPGDPVMRAAGEVAVALGLTPPAGPPPPPMEPVAAPVAAAPAPVPAVPVRAPAGPEAAAAELEREQRAARAMAAMKLDLAAFDAKPRSRSGPGWLVPVVLVCVLIAALFMGLNMLKKLAASGKGATPAGYAPPDPGAALVGPAASTQDVPPALMPTAPAPTSPDLVPAQSAQQRAEQLMRVGDWAGLVSHAEAWAKAQPESDAPWELLSIAHSRLGDYNTAAENLRHLLARNPSPRYRAMLADAYLQGERLDEAAAMYKQVVVDSPNDARVWSNYGTALAGTNQLPQAIAALENAVRLDPALKTAWTNLGNAYKATGDSAKASAAWANAR